MDKGSTKTAPSTGNNEAEVAEKPSEPTLYDKFGGNVKCEAFMDKFMDGVMKCPTLSTYHEGIDEPTMELLKEKRVCYMKYLLDGSKFYIGKDLKEVHQPLGITDEIFDTWKTEFLKHLKTMRPNIKVLRAISKKVTDLREDIVVKMPSV